MRTSSPIAIVLLAVLCALAGGCMNKGAAATSIVAQQTPGQSTGAGATFQGPANSAAPSSQVAQRRAAYYAPTVPSAPTTPVAAPVTARSSDTVTTSAAPSTTIPAAPVSQLSTLSSQLPPTTPPPAPAWIDERTETTFGQHQDAAGLVQAATAMGSWGRARWFGLLCVFFSVLALAWAHNNPEGYPLVAWKIGGVGLFLIIFDPSPWWLLLLLIPAGFYIIQKLKITLPV